MPSEVCEDEAAGGVLDVLVGEAVGVIVAPVAVVVRVAETSAGKYSKGLNSIVAFRAYWNCCAKVSVAFWFFSISPTLQSTELI